MAKLKALEDIKRAIRAPYAWPGGYPVYTVLSDGGLLCAKCARAEFRQITCEGHMKTLDLIPRSLSQSCRDGACETIQLGGHYSALIEVMYDPDLGAPWEEHDGHGPVSDWRPKESKGPGERILHEDRGSALFYDFAAAVALARRDGWGSEGDAGLTKGAKAARAVERDFERLRAWCNSEWYWVGVSVTLYYAGTEVQSDSLWGIESDGDYWREVAAECLDNCRAEEKTARRKALAERRESRHRAAVARCFC